MGCGMRHRQACVVRFEAVDSALCVVSAGSSTKPYSMQPIVQAAPIMLPCLVQCSCMLNLAVLLAKQAPTKRQPGNTQRRRVTPAH